MIHSMNFNVYVYASVPSLQKKKKKKKKRTRHSIFTSFSDEDFIVMPESRSETRQQPLFLTFQRGALTDQSAQR